MKSTEELVIKVMLTFFVNGNKPMTIKDLLSIPIIRQAADEKILGETLNHFTNRGLFYINGENIFEKGVLVETTLKWKLNHTDVKVPSTPVAPIAPSIPNPNNGAVGKNTIELLQENHYDLSDFSQKQKTFLMAMVKRAFNEGLAVKREDEI